jgi:hypothetical protein
MKRITFLLINTITIASAILALCSPDRSEPANATISVQPGNAEQVREDTDKEDKGEEVYLPIVGGKTEVPDSPSGDGTWPMAGGNTARTSWTSEEVRGRLKPLWFRPIEPYISQKTQIIASNGNLYISTARGLYALDAQTGAEKWVYPTELPLGHSPTIANGIAYVGGFDRKMHAINALTGAGLWTFTAGAGFDTNPLVVDGKVFAGNRDGYFYAIHASGSLAGQLAWKYKTGGPIHFSAAYKDGTIYFASNDSHAYAVNAQSGSLVWKSAKLPGAGFHSWWPVVYRDWVIISGSSNYRFGIKPGAGPLHDLDLADVYPNHKRDPRGTPVGLVGEVAGDWVPGTPTIDASKSNSIGSTTPITEYFEAKPWRRTYFVLERSTGKEVTYDFDGDGKKEYAPILWQGTRSGNRYPPVVGSDGVLYQANNLWSDPTIAGGHISGWKIGTPYISVPNGGWNAVDEPVAYTAGGDLIYWSRCCDRIAGAFDITIPEVVLATSDTNIRQLRAELDRSWNYFSYNLPSVVPGYDVMVHKADPYDSPFGGVYGGRNGSYGFHGDVNPPVPYQGKVFMHRSNAIIAFAPNAGSPAALPTAKIVKVENAGIPRPSDGALKSLLESEVEKILAAGHLRPGYAGTGIFDIAASRSCGESMVDYWHHPGDILDTLTRALPYLSADLQSRTKTYLKSEFEKYPPYKYNHIGWANGAPREVFILPNEAEQERLSSNPQSRADGFEGWGLAPHSFYALWKYAQVFGDAKSIFDASKSQLELPPPDSYLADMPHVLNAYIAGYWGYLELEKLAGYAETTSVRSDLNRLLELRVSKFTKDAPEEYYQGLQPQNCRNLNVSRNFIYLVPELGDYLREKALAKVQEALGEYERVAPHWFVSRAEVAFGEGTINHSYDYAAIFQAKALILGASRAELGKYLDIPAFPVGDLYYIQNLVYLLQAD